LESWEGDQGGVKINLGPGNHHKSVARIGDWLNFGKKTKKKRKGIASFLPVGGWNTRKNGKSGGGANRMDDTKKISKSVGETPGLQGGRVMVYVGNPKTRERGGRWRVPWVVTYSKGGGGKKKKKNPTGGEWGRDQDRLKPGKFDKPGEK